MTGPEHYECAEADLREADINFESDVDRAALYYRAAQVHATLALAAATALNEARNGMPRPDWAEWIRVGSAWKPVTE